MKLIKFVKIIILIIIVFISVGIYLILSDSSSSPSLAPTAKNFEECVKASYHVEGPFPRQCWSTDGRYFYEKVEQAQLQNPTPGKIIVRGVITCLPKIGQGTQTLECAQGLRETNGRFYGLKNLLQFDSDGKFQTEGVRLEVSGIFSPNENEIFGGRKYDIKGTIEVTSIKEIANSKVQ